MSSKNNAKQINEMASSKKNIIILAIVLISMSVLFDLSPLGGNIRFYSKWVECGQKPVQIQSLPGKAWYEDSPAFMPLLRNQSWFCSPIDAERAGYSATKNYFTTPNLKAVGEPNQFEKQFPETR